MNNFCRENRERGDIREDNFGSDREVDDFDFVDLEYAFRWYIFDQL